jgi:hypothetical protein
MGLGLTNRAVGFSTSFFVCLCCKFTEGSVEVSTCDFVSFEKTLDRFVRFSVLLTSEVRGRRALVPRARSSEAVFELNDQRTSSHREFLSSFLFCASLCAFFR